MALFSFLPLRRTVDGRCRTLVENVEHLEMIAESGSEFDA